MRHCNCCCFLTGLQIKKLPKFNKSSKFKDCKHAHTRKRKGYCKLTRSYILSYFGCPFSSRDHRRLAYSERFYLHMYVANKFDYICKTADPTTQNRRIGLAQRSSAEDEKLQWGAPRRRSGWWRMIWRWRQRFRKKMVELQKQRSGRQSETDEKERAPFFSDRNDADADAATAVKKMGRALTYTHTQTETLLRSSAVVCVRVRVTHWAMHGQNCGKLHALHLRERGGAPAG